MGLFIRNLLAVIALPGTTAVLVPYLLVTRQGPLAVGFFGPLQLLALLPLLLGTLIGVRCVFDFAVHGRGTPAPIDAPRRLVARGLYRYVRNPMYIGVLLIVLGEAALFESMTLLLYAAAFFAVLHLFVVLYEEPTLRRKFGDSYLRYSRSVRRWVPGRPYDPEA